MSTETGHYHALGDVVIDKRKLSKKYPNGACRCAAHIAPPLRATRAVPQCSLECYMCERARVLKAEGFGQ